MNPKRRARFDELLEHVIHELPEGIRTLLDEVPVIVEDHPSRELIEELAAEAGEDPDDWAPDELCGLHTGTAFTERTVEAAHDMPSDIMLFRDGIVAEAGGWDNEKGEAEILRQIRITLLHEIGHQFGLDEDDLQRLGYD